MNFPKHQEQTYVLDSLKLMNNAFVVLMYSIGIEPNMLFVIEVGKTQKKSRCDFCCVDAFCKYFIELTHLMMRILDKVL
jgi:hypothetical protein